MMVFMASGIATPLLIGLLHRQGACGQETMFSVFPNYAIMIFTVCGDWQSRHRGIVRWRSVAMATVVDAVSQGANYTGLIQAGSSYYVLIYSSVTVWVPRKWPPISPTKVDVRPWGNHICTSTAWGTDYYK